MMRQDMKGKDWDAIYIRPTAPNTRGGLLQRIENDLLLVIPLHFASRAGYSMEVLTEATVFIRTAQAHV